MTKIIATYGPSIKNSNKKITERNIFNLLQSGVNIFRFNASHGSNDEKKNDIDLIRKVAKKNNKIVKILYDTKGPEIRLGNFNEKIVIKKNQIIKMIFDGNLLCNDKEFSIYGDFDKNLLLKNITLNSYIYIDDGNLTLIVKFIDENSLTLECCNDWSSTNNKKVTFPRIDFVSENVSKRDKEDIIFACSEKCEYIALSFLTKIEQLNNFKKIVLENNYHPYLIGKIENETAIKNIDSLIDNCDSIMIARGDLATETSYELIPEYQNMIVEKCSIAKKPVILATEILASCERNLRPTRAEVTDAYFAITSDVDILMLSGETANGIDPINAVKILKTIIDKYEKKYFETKEINADNFEISKSNKNIFYILKKVDLKKENNYFLYKNIYINF